MLNRNTIIRTVGLTAGFGERLLFRDVNLEIREGDFVLIRGENGAGKTTLIKLLLGLLRPAAGRMYVFDAEVGSRAWRRKRRLAAYLGQHASASDFPISAREVAEIGTAALPLPGREKRRLALEAMAAADCLRLKDAPYAVLSGGEKQRVSLARCLAQQARLLFLDEPASHLDARAKADFMDVMQRCHRERGITVVLVSHEHHDHFNETGGVTRLTFTRTAAAGGDAPENEIEIGGRA